MATLVIYLAESWLRQRDDSPLADATVHWLLVDRSGVPAARGTGLADTAALTEPIDRVVAVLPAECATSLPATVPPGQRRRLVTVVPYVLEDELAAPIEEMHFAVGGLLPSGSYPVIAIERALLRDALARLTAAGQAPTAVYLDSDVLAAAATELRVLDLGERVLLNAGGEHMLAVAPQDVALALTSLWETTTLDRVRVVHGAQTTAFWAQQLAATVIEGSENATEVCADPVAQLLARSAQTGAVNLLSGEFAPSGRAARLRSWLALGLTAAALIGVLQAGYFLLAGWYLQGLASDQQRMAEALYRDIFPGDRQLLNPRAQAEGHLRAAETSLRGQLTTYLGVFGPLWRASATAASEIHSFSYEGRDNTLRVDLGAPSVEAVEQLAVALRARALRADLLSVRGEGSGIRAKLVIGSAGVDGD